MWAAMQREWLLGGAAVAWALMAWYLHRLPVYDWKGLEPIFLLWVLFVLFKGIERHGLLQKLARQVEKGSFLASKMVVLAFAFSLMMSIDASLVVLIPLIFALKTRQKLALSVLVALTAHLGSALTPFGTPQNLFIFRYYGPDLWAFVRVIAPFSLGFFLLYLGIAFFLKVESPVKRGRKRHSKVAWHPTLWYLAGFFLTVGVVVDLLPVWVLTPILPAVALLDARSLRVDYALLLTFVLFLGLADNARILIGHDLDHPHHIFLLSATLSQFISNVPTTLLMTPLTQRWEALLWGTNAGGFGTPVAAMANLIAYRLVAFHADRSFTLRYLRGFTLAGAATLLLASGLYFSLIAPRIG